MFPSLLSGLNWFLSFLDPVFDTLFWFGGFWSVVIGFYATFQMIRSCCDTGYRCLELKRLFGCSKQLICACCPEVLFFRAYKGLHKKNLETDSYQKGGKETPPKSTTPEITSGLNGMKKFATQANLAQWTGDQDVRDARAGRATAPVHTIAPQPIYGVIGNNLPPTYPNLKAVGPVINENQRDKK